MSGPARIPAAVLELTGSRLGKRRAAAEKVAGIVAAEPETPAYLDERAREEWTRLVPILLERRILTDADGSVLGEHCQAAADVERYSRALETSGEVVATPNGALQRHPYTVLLREARERLLKTASLLGLTPADRTRPAAVEKARDNGPEAAHFA